MPEDVRLLRHQVLFSDEPFEKYYEINEELGSGQFAVVRRCIHLVTGVEYAAKFIKKRRFQSSRRGVKRQDIEREVQVLREIGGHENVIALYEVYETPTEVILVIELVSGGELFDHVCSKECLSEAEAAAFIDQILCGAQHLHRQHVVHLDIKPENVMLLKRGETKIKLIDFGLSRKIPPGVPVKDMIGTPEFVAPEIVNYELLSPATDMWAVGVVTYILLSGASPFLGASREETFCNITGVSYRFDEDYFTGVSPLAKDFICRLFVRDPRKRASVTDCLRHPWIKGPVIGAGEVDLRQSSEVNLSNIHAFKVKRRWKQACHAVILCLRLTREAKQRLELAQQHCEPECKIRSRFNSNCTSNSSSNSPVDVICFPALVVKHGLKVSSCRSGDDRHWDKQSIWPQDLLLSALLCASEEGNTTGLEELCTIPSLNINMANELGETAMHVGAGSGQKDIVCFLQMKGAKVDLPDKHGDTPLHWAARHGHGPVVKHLCEEEVPINKPNRCGETPLHQAVKYAQTDAVLLLCENGSNVNAQDEHGETPLHIASWHGFALVLELLCRYGPQLHVQNKDEETALHCAAARGHLECVTSLLDGGSPLDAQDKAGQTALHLALRRQHMDIGLLLMTKGCRLDVQDANGETPLHVACRNGILTAVQTLCHLGSPVDILNTSTLAPLHIAAKEGHIEIVRCLCLAGANINIKNKDGLTAEIMALAQDKTFVGSLLGKLKQDQQKETYIEQLCPLDLPLKRIKMKLFGHSNTGKTRLCQSLQTGMIGGLFGSLSRRLSETSPSHNAKDESPTENGAEKAAKWRKHSLEHKPAHSNYTKGIEVQTLNVPNCGEFSAWEFSGYEPYHQVYDHFVGNTDCIHIVLFRATDPTEIQYQQVLYWMNFLKGRVTPTEPIGHCGVMSRRSKVVLICTHADQVSPPLQKDADGEFFSTDGDALLNTVRLRFGADFDIHERLIFVDGHQPNCPGLKSLRNYLANARNAILLRLPKLIGLFDAAINYLQGVRKQHASFPVITWPYFTQLVRNVNPLAGESHCRQLIQQLQLTGEVVYLKDETQELDYVVLSPEWLGCHIIGTLLSAEFISRCRITGSYIAEDFIPIYPEISEAVDLLQILDTLQLCSQCDTSGDLEYEFPAFNLLEPPNDVWELDHTTFAYGGVRIQATPGMERTFGCLFPRVQVALRRSMQDFQDPMDAELIQWKNLSKMSSGQMEALVRLCHEKDNAVEVQVRGPSDLASSCFYFLEDIANLIEQTANDVAPGLSLERHFLSPKDLSDHQCSPAVYPPESVMQMQRRESISVRNNREGEELFTDVVCFGAREVATVLTLGIDLSVAQLPLPARRELAALLDPADSMGRDWSILAVKLDLMDQLPEVDSTGPALSRTDQLLAEWALQSPDQATVGNLCDVLCELSRKDAVEALYRTVPLYLVASMDDTPTSLHSITDGTDSGVASCNQSHTTSGTSQRSSSTLSR